MHLVNRSFAFCLILLGASFSALYAADQPPELKLPDSVAPVSYQATLEMDPKQTGFSGEIRIKVQVKQAVKTIWLNASDIAISKVDLVTGGNSRSAQPVPGGVDFIGLSFDSPVTAGPAELDIHYTGKLRVGSNTGAFQAQDNGNKYIFTQFEQTDARDAFPCFDEPGYKVPWQLSLSVPQEDDAVSNTPVENQELSAGRKVLHFKQTKPLPSYLIAFAIGQFDFVPAGYAGKNRAPVRIVTPKGHASEAKYAAEVTATILTRLEDYFGIPFPYEKSDQVAVPVSFFGAMENAGMVTYAQTLLLENPDRNTLQHQRDYASVAAHELAHQWFGDLVTTAWWDDIWLNEAFATWMEQKILAEWKPEWQTRVEDVNSKLGAEAQDTLLSARKIRQEIKTRDDISNAFDSITYLKGAAVIGMFESWVGAPAFRNGVQAYLKKHAFKTATAPEFLASISSQSPRDVTQPFSSFLNQPGVPLVSVALDCSAPSPVLHLEQQRSVPPQSKPQPSQLWQIPVCVRYSIGEEAQHACTLLADPRTDFKLAGKGCPAWIQANNNAVGYYRVAYGDNLLANLTKGDVQHRLNAPERVDLLGNSQALATNNRMPSADVLRLVPQFHADPSRYVIERAIQVAQAPRAHLVPDGLLPNYQRFVQKNFQARARELGWMPKPNESDDDRLLRPALVSFVATDGDDQQLAREAQKLTQKWFTDSKAIPADEVSAVLGTAADGGDKSLFDQFLTRLKQTQDRQEREQIISALGKFNDPAALQGAMEALLHEEIPFMDGLPLLFAGQHSAHTRKLGFNFVKQNFDKLPVKKPTFAGAEAGAYLVYSGNSFCDAESESELKSFFESRAANLLGAPRMLAQVLEGIHACIANKAAQEPGVEEFLKGF